jgi:S-adenosylmethionine synthetase
MIRTAEFVSPKHPDKLCDRISDTLVDLYLSGDENSRCAIETCGGHGKVFITGEVTSTTDITDDDIRSVVYNISGIEDTIINLVKQSPEIAQGVDTGGAGDQGIMIGYACRENEDLVPQEYYLARLLNKVVYNYFPYDGKTQVTIMENNNVRVVCSFQNAPKSELETICTNFFEDEGYTIESLHCNPAGDWNIGGFEADAGLTGRKLAVDNYGPRIPIGGGAFSGKDATKVDRSAAYMARVIAVEYLQKYTHVNEVEVQLSYAIGYDQPLQATAMFDNNPSLTVNVTEYDLSPNGIIKYLDLKKPIFSQTCEWGHMGNKFNWK